VEIEIQTTGEARLHDSGRDEQGVLKWPVIENKKGGEDAELGVETPVVVPGGRYMMKVARQKETRWVQWRFFIINI